MRKNLNIPEIEKKLGELYKGKVCALNLPGKKPVYGMVDDIGIETFSEPIVVVQINDHRYTVSLDSIRECLNTL